MLHPIDYRLSKNKFWLSNWNSYSLKNYRNLIFNDKILNVLGHIFKNCFKLAYPLAAPWSNNRKNRKNYGKHIIIGFDGRRIIPLADFKVKKLPSFILPDGCRIVRFRDFSILQIQFLIDNNINNWRKKQTNRRSPLFYLNILYLRNKKKSNLPFFKSNFFKWRMEKQNFRSNAYLFNVLTILNDVHLRRLKYFNYADEGREIKIDKVAAMNYEVDGYQKRRHQEMEDAKEKEKKKEGKKEKKKPMEYFQKERLTMLSRFYYQNIPLINKVRNNYFLFYYNKFQNKRNIFNKSFMFNSMDDTNISQLNFFLKTKLIYNNTKNYKSKYISNNLFSKKLVKNFKTLKSLVSLKKKKKGY